MSESLDRTQVLGQAGESCGACGAPLAADQRYCLNCGERRGPARLDFRTHLPASAAAPAGAGGAQAGGSRETNGRAAAPEERPPQRDYTPLAAVGGIAVLGLMLLVGVLIGKGDSSTPAPAPIVRVAGDSGAETASGDAADKSAATPKKTSGKAAKGGRGGNSRATAPDTGAAVKASDEDLEALQQQSPEEYQKSSAKLPNEIATGGPPPPTDSKAPGGGSKGTAIE